jgi:hypothetical protein
MYIATSIKQDFLLLLLALKQHDFEKIKPGALTAPEIVSETTKAAEDVLAHADLRLDVWTKQ